MDLITVSSHHDMREEREAVLPGLFPAAASEPRPRLFAGKKVRVGLCGGGGGKGGVCEVIEVVDHWGVYYGQSGV